MKIYSSRNNKQSLDNYVGKDIWVKVYDGLFNIAKYVRILREDNDKYICNRLPAYIIDDLGSRNQCSAGQVYLYTNYCEYTVDKSGMHLCLPIECLTTEEIIDALIEE